MSIIDTMLRQTAVYWALGGDATGGVDIDEYGQPVYLDPIEISVRWEDVSTKIKTDDGQEVMSRSTVFTSINVRKDALLFLGELTDLPAGVDPREVDGAWEIMRFDKLPNLKNTKILRTAYL